eukprot:gene15691-6983_t
MYLNKHLDAEIESDEKKRIMKNLLKVVEGTYPDPELNDEKVSTEDISGWNEAIASDNLITVQMETLASFIECRSAFDQDVFHADEQVTLKIYLRSTAVMPIKISNLSVIFNNQVYNQVSLDAHDEDPASENKHSSLVLHPGKVKFVSFSFIPLLSDIGTKLEVKQILLNLGKKVILKWDSAGDDANFQGAEYQNMTSGRVPVSRNRAGDVRWDSVQIHPVAELVPRKCDISLDFVHDPPLYVGEFYQVVVDVTNNEKFEISNVCVNMNLKVDGEEKTSSRLLKSLTSTESPQDEESEVTFDINNLAPGEKASSCVYVNGLQEGEEHITAKDNIDGINKVSFMGAAIACQLHACVMLPYRSWKGQDFISTVTYEIVVPCGDSDQDVTCQCAKEESLAVKVMSPLSVSYQFYNMQFEVIDKVNAKEPFLLFCKLGSAPRWPILIQSTYFDLNGKVLRKNGDVDGHLNDIEISEGNEATECHCLVTSADSCRDEVVSFGDFVIEWKRTDSSINMPWVTTKVPLPDVVVAEVPIYIDTRIPSCGCVQEALPVTYKIYNRTDMVQEVEVEIEPSEAFMFSGNRQKTLNNVFRALPSTAEVATARAGAQQLRRDPY